MSLNVFGSLSVASVLKPWPVVRLLTMTACLPADSLTVSCTPVTPVVWPRVLRLWPRREPERFGKPECSAWVRFCVVCEAPDWVTRPRNPATATARRVLLNDRGRSWSTQTGSECSTIGLSLASGWLLPCLLAKSLSTALTEPLVFSNQPQRCFLSKQRKERGKYLKAWLHYNIF